MEVQVGKVNEIVIASLLEVLAAPPTAATPPVVIYFLARVKMMRAHSMHVYCRHARVQLYLLLLLQLLFLLLHGKFPHGIRPYMRQQLWPESDYCQQQQNYIVSIAFWKASCMLPVMAFLLYNHAFPVGKQLTWQQNLILFQQ